MADSIVMLQVILSVRDPDKWYDSYVASLLWLYRTWWFKPFSWCLPMGWKLQVCTLLLVPLSCRKVAILCSYHRAHSSGSSCIGN